MRYASFVVLALAVAPALLSAQRFPVRIGNGGISVPADLPPQPPAVARQLDYLRAPLSVETYPMVSYFVAPGFVGANAAGHWASAGVGTRADYRVTRLISATFDMTTSFLGGPADNATAEVGTRFRPERNERRVYPFLDLRLGYSALYDVSFDQRDYVYGYPSSGPIGYGAHYSQGIGAVAGVGSEFALGRQFSLITAGSVMRGRMTAYNVQGAGSHSTFGMTQYRYTLGLRYNPVRTNPLLAR